MGYWYIRREGESSFVLIDTRGARVLVGEAGGMPPVENLMLSYAALPGAFLQGIRVGVRVIVLALVAGGGVADAVGASQPVNIGTTRAGLHGSRQNLIDVVKPASAFKTQTVELEYRGGVDGANGQALRIKAVYDGGLEGSGRYAGYVDNSIFLPLIASDPFWYETTESSAELAESQNGGVAYAEKSADGYAFFDHPSSDLPDAIAYADGTLYTIEASSSEIIIRSYDGSSWTTMDTISVIGTPSGRDILVDHAGDIWVTYDAGVAGGKLARWDGSDFVEQADTIVNPGRLVSIPGRGIWWAESSSVVRYEGSTKTTVATANGIVYDLTLHRDGYVYAGGVFTTVEAVATGQVARYDIDADTWEAVATLAWSSGTPQIFRVHSFGDYVYVFGLFDTIGGSSIDDEARWNGFGWDDTGLNVQIDDMTVRDADVLFVAADTDVYQYLRQQWQLEALAIPDGSLIVSTADGFIVENSADSYTAAGETTAAYGGTADAHPYVTFENTGSALITLYQIENVTSGHRVWFQDLSVLAGETVTVRFGPLGSGVHQVTSDQRGVLVGKIKQGSQMSSFALVASDTPGQTSRDNLILMYASDGANLTTTMKWTARHWSYDAGAR